MDIKFLKGIGEARAKLLREELQIESVEDLLMYVPFRYVDKSRIYRINELVENGAYMQVKGRFVRFVEEGEGRKKRLRALFSDGHANMEIVWFSGLRYFKNAYSPDKEYLLFGKPSFYKGSWSMAHPEVEDFDSSRPQGGMAGIYPLTDALRKKGLSSKFFQSVVRNALNHEEFAKIRESLPAQIISARKLMSLHEALRQLHQPSDPASLQKARERMKFEELYYLELNILRFARERQDKTEGIKLPKVGEKFNNFFKNVLPFELTGAQKRVIREIKRDMNTGRQMNRLLQGDVGSGKTMVAFLTMLLGIDNGVQTALMAPTEILATQHFETLKSWADKIGVSIRLLTGSTKVKERREIHSMLVKGELDILVGTHALIEEKVKFRKLGIAIIDEQHRFGVAQRAGLWNKSEVPPHILVMTATPIPRTLAMTVYGDLDVSVIDELPPGRKPIDTHLFFEEGRNMAYRLVSGQIKEGRQAYIVYPLIKENEKLDLKSLEKGVERLRGIFKGINLSYVHGRMKPEEKELQMQRFVEGETKILVATTVIEVGVNVPNASVMLIENAERFGLSQLHQLRGRVGRGAEKSYCILMSKDSGSRETKQRLGIMTETTDGFLISEADLKMRGPGDIEGTQQSGLAFNLKIANLARDGQILSVAREMAMKTLDAFPEIYQANVRQNSWKIEDSERANTLSILLRELHKRFAKENDWSKIS